MIQIFYKLLTTQASNIALKLQKISKLKNVYWKLGKLNTLKKVTVFFFLPICRISFEIASMLVSSQKVKRKYVVLADLNHFVATQFWTSATHTLRTTDIRYSNIIVNCNIIAFFYISVIMPLYIQSLCTV